VILRTVTGIDVVGRAVLIGESRIPDDQLVIATGARESYFGHNEWATVTSGLKTIEDTTTMRRPILIAFEPAESCADEIERQRQLTLVIIGGRPTGVELAGTLAELAKAALACDFRHIDPTTARIVLIGAGPPDRIPHPDGGGDRLAVVVRAGRRFLDHRHRATRGPARRRDHPAARRLHGDRLMTPAQLRSTQPSN
jgi:hypothetical protein